MKKLPTGKNKAQGYYETYNNQILPLLTDIEKSRLEQLKKFRMKSFLCFGLPAILFLCIGLACLYCWIFYPSSNVAFYLGLICSCWFPFILIFSPLFYVADRKKEIIKFSTMLKKSILSDLLNAFGDISWKGHDVSAKNLGDVLLTDSELKRSGLFIPYNTRFTDDEYRGVYENVEFKISETELLYISGSGKRRTIISAFKGVVISFKYNRKIKNRTIISTKGDLTQKNQALIMATVFTTPFIELFKDGYAHWKVISMVILFVIVYLITQKVQSKEEERLDEVRLEDPKFSKRFNVYSSDQIEARYLVSPAFMERFYDLQTAFGAKKIKCSFVDETLMIAIETNKNLFEIGSLFKSLNDPTSINNFYNELASIYKMIDYFKLYENVYLSK